MKFLQAATLSLFVLTLTCQGCAWRHHRRHLSEASYPIRVDMGRNVTTTVEIFDGKNYRTTGPVDVIQHPNGIEFVQSESTPAEPARPVDAPRAAEPFSPFRLDVPDPLFRSPVPASPHPPLPDPDNFKEPFSNPLNSEPSQARIEPPQESPAPPAPNTLTDSANESWSSSALTHLATAVASIFGARVYEKATKPRRTPEIDGRTLRVEEVG